MAERTTVDIPARWERLAAVAPHEVKVLRAEYGKATDPTIRRKEPEWMVQAADGRIVFVSPDDEQVAAFLSVLSRR
jgi:hypothetical protein